MLLDRIEPASETADILIVGAGAVGLTMGIALARAGKRVLLCEAGQARLDPEWQAHNHVVQGGRHHLGSLDGRYRGLGGTTRLWGGQLMPFTTADLAPNPDLGKPGWPLRHAELMDAVDAVLQLTGVAQSWAETEAKWCAVTGQGLDLAFGLRLAPSLWLPQPDLARLFGRELRQSRALSVLVGHEAIGLQCRPDGSVAGLRLRRPDGHEVIVTGQATVLACGTIETARLLLRIAAAWPSSPLAKNVHVGRWFFDHLHGDAGEVRLGDKVAFGRLFDSFYSGGRKLMPKVRLCDQEVARRGVPNCAGLFVGPMSPGLVVQDLRQLLGRIIGSDAGRYAALSEAVQMVRLILPLVLRYLAAHRSAHFIGTTARFRMEMEQLPTAESYLALEEGVPAEHARIKVNWSLDRTQVADFTGFASTVRDYCDQTGLGRLELDPRLLSGDARYFDDCRDSNHQMGGARMANRAGDGVVDPNCQVFGMPGLFVAGAPTFPSGSFANPTLVGMALGQRLVSHLLKGTR